MSKQVQSFQTEIKELLNLMIHSLYSNREIFLRELISNSSDAIDKLKFESIQHPDWLQSGAEFQIQLIPNPQMKTLTIQDNGIGMTQQELVENLGTIAHSGTKKFIELAQQSQQKAELIGQFGVGFYPAFMVAKKVVVITQKAGTQTATRWESEGEGTYSIEECARPEGHGTTLVLYLKDRNTAGADEENAAHEQDFTDTHILKDLVKKYSDFIAYPIKLKVEESKPEETVNSQQALWLKPASEIKPEEYTDFYRQLAHDWKDPLKTIHFKAEGTIEFSALLFIPEQKPFDFDMGKLHYGLSLYVKRVLIKNPCEELLPQYLRFVRGVVDTSDLSLNVSREMLQQDARVSRMKRSVTNKILQSLKQLLEQDRTAYEKFWTVFGYVLKEGIPLEPAQKEALQDLFLFRSSQTKDGWVTLQEYVSRMKPEQKAIYTITGENIEQVSTSPYLEGLVSKGFEVFYLVDRVDEWLMNTFKAYQDKPLQSITSEELELDASSVSDETQKQYEPLLKQMKTFLADRVQDVRVSKRLTESPVCLVSPKNEVSAHMERILSSMGQELGGNRKRILEINPQHALFSRMALLTEKQQKDWAEILYELGVLNEGGKVTNPQQYGVKIAHLLLESSGK